MTGKEIFIIQSNALRIKLEMLKQGKTHRKFAEEIGISPGTLTNLLKVAKNDEDEPLCKTGFGYTFAVLLKASLALGLQCIEIKPEKLVNISTEYNELKNKKNEQSR